MRCALCLEPGHLIPDCPEAMRMTLHSPVVAPPLRTASDELNDILSERMLMYRACKNALLGYAVDQGWIYPDMILRVDPDYPTT